MTEYRAIRTPEQRGAAGWNAILPPSPPPQSLEENQTADFVVVGAGFAGLSAARRLRQLVPDARIVVLEAGRVAEGASGRNSGFMIDLPHNLPGAAETAGRGEAELIALNRQAQDFAEQAVLDYGIDRNFLKRSGKINGAVDGRTEAILTHEKAHLEKIGEPFEWLDAKDMQRVTGSAYYSAGLYTPGTVMLQPAGYIRGLAAGLRRKGTLIYEESAVVGFARNGADWTVRTAQAEVRTGRVILAVNGHLESFGVASGRLMQLFLFGAFTRALDADQVAALGGRADLGSHTCRSDGGHRPTDRSRAGRQSDRYPRCGSVAIRYEVTRHGYATGRGHDAEAV